MQLFESYAKTQNISLNSMGLKAQAKALPSIVSEEKNNNKADTLIGKLTSLDLPNKSAQNEQAVKNSLPDHVFSSVCNWCYGAATQMAKLKGKNNSITNNLPKIVSKIMDSTASMMKLNQDAQNTISKDFNNKITKGEAPLQTSNAYELNQLRLTANVMSEGVNLQFTECANPFYYMENEYNLSNLDPASQKVVNVIKSKPVKATILTLVTFIVTLLITNVIRIYLGGTPGGDFGTPWQQGLFTFFTSLFLAPIIEEPAKMIAIRGGYGKHFFFAFNFLEFGGHLLMFLATGSQGLGVFIILRGICVIFHAISMIIMKRGGRGPVSTTFKIAFCVLLHFAFNALFLKYAGTLAGLGASQLLMFAMGFFGVAFGVFKVAKLGGRLVRKGVTAMTGRRGR